MNNNSIKVLFALEEHVIYSEQICQLIYESALQRGTGIAKRSPEYISAKIKGGKAVVALDGDRLVGFSYIAAQIKARTFELARARFPYAKIFSITTSLPVMKLNTRLGYKPVTFSELTDDEEFWKGCEGCCNYDILQRNNRRMCLCTGMLYDPKTPLPGSSSFQPYWMVLKNKIKKLFHLK